MIKIEHGKLIFRPQQKQQQNNIIPIIFRPQQKQQQNNIIPFPSFITNKTEQKRNGNKTHKHKLTACAEEWPIPVKTRTAKR